MSVGPRIFPATVDTSDGTVSLTQALVIIDYAGDPLTASRVRVFAPDTSCVLDEPVAVLRVGQAPTMVYGRHELVLADGRVLWVLLERGCGCGAQLKGFYPSKPATSGPRP